MPDYNRETAAALDKIMQGVPDAKAGKMFGMPAYKVNGRLAVGMYMDSAVVKVGAERAKTLVGKDGVSAFEPQPGRVWKDWVAVSGDLQKHRVLFEEAVRYVQSEAK